MVENVNPGFLFLGQNHFSPLTLRNWITLANSPGKQQQVWQGPTKGKNVAQVYFILARKEGSGILTSFLLVFITSNTLFFFFTNSTFCHELHTPRLLYSERFRFTLTFDPMLKFHPAQAKPGEFLYCLESFGPMNF